MIQGLNGRVQGVGLGWNTLELRVSTEDVDGLVLSRKTLVFSL